MKAKLWGWIFSILFCSVAFAQQSGKAPLNIKTQDGTVSTYPYQLNVTNGTLTDNGDGTASLTTGGSQTPWTGNINGAGYTLTSVPTIIGSTVSNGTLSLVGSNNASNTATSAAINLNVGNSGAIKALTVLNNGNVGIGAVNPSSLLTVSSSSGTGTSEPSPNNNNINYATFINTNAATNILSQGAGIQLSGNGWASSSSQQMDYRIYIVPQTNNNPTLYIDSQKNGGGWTNIYNIDSYGQLGYAVKFNSYDLASKDLGLQLGNDDNATNSQNGNTPYFHWYSQGWKTNSTAASQYMSFDESQTITTGAISPVGAHEYLYGINNSSTSSSNELMRFQWGSDSGILGTFFNQQSLSGYTFSVNSPIVNPASASSSTAMLSATGALYTGGTGTTTVPLWYWNNGASNPSSWSTNGTFLGANAASGFTGNFLDFHVNGGSSVFSVGYNGAVSTSGLNSAKSPLYGAKGDGSTDDTTAIQACLNSSLGSCYLPPGTYEVSSTLIVPAASGYFTNGFEFVLDQQAVIQPTANVNVVQLNNKARLTGGTIDAHNLSTFTSALIYENGALGLSNGGGADHVKLNGYNSGSTYAGTGIYLNANAASANIVFQNFHDITILNTNYGILLQAASTGGSNYVTGCNFNNIVINNGNYEIYVDGNNTNTNQAWGNNFTNINLQADATTVDMIYTSGDYNIFSGMIWDVTGSTDAIVTTSSSGYNQFYTNYSNLSSNVSIAGTSNYFTGGANSATIPNNNSLILNSSTGSSNSYVQMTSGNNLNISNPYSGGQVILQGNLATKVYGSPFIVSPTALTPSGTVNITAGTSNVFTLTPAQTETITASGFLSGQYVDLIILTSGTTSYTLTFSTGIKYASSTLATGTVSGKYFVIHYVSDGNYLIELSRSAAE